MSCIKQANEQPKSGEMPTSRGCAFFWVSSVNFGVWVQNRQRKTPVKYSQLRPFCIMLRFSSVQERECYLTIGINSCLFHGRRPQRFAEPVQRLFVLLNRVDERGKPHRLQLLFCAPPLQSPKLRRQGAIFSKQSSYRFW